MAGTDPEYVRPEESLTDLVARIQFKYLQAIDFSSTDSDALEEIVRRLTKVAQLFNVLSVTEFGGRAGQERESGLCEQVLGSAFQFSFGEAAHPDPFDKASFILRGLIAGHPFEDGNKRTGFLMAYYYLDQVGYPPIGEFSEEDVVRFCFAISKGEIRDLAIIQENLIRLWGYTAIA